MAPKDKKKAREDQGTRWCFTFYNEADLEKLRLNPLEALVVALEEGTDEKREHFQGYCKFSSNKRWSWWQRTFHTEEDQSAHWELAKGREWQCRRYIVDVEAYLRENPQAHFKTQGRVLHDYGCEVHVAQDAPPLVKVIQMCVEGAKASQIFREHPILFFHNYRKIRDLQECITSWRETGEDFKPSSYEPPRKRIKADPPEDSV